MTTQVDISRAVRRHDGENGLDWLLGFEGLLEPEGTRPKMSLGPDYRPEAHERNCTATNWKLFCPVYSCGKGNHPDHVVANILRIAHRQIQRGSPSDYRSRSRIHEAAISAKIP